MSRILNNIVDLGVNVFGLWKHISNHTFCSQSQFMVEKFPNEILLKIREFFHHKPTL